VTYFGQTQIAVSCHMLRSDDRYCTVIHEDVTTDIVMSNVNLQFVVGSLSFYTSCRKGSGIQVNVCKQTEFREREKL
jgi:hypothetical protein